MKGIPTVYKGCQFRSRLEAKWAAMFDLLGWRWLYEPIDLDGYIPDFVLLSDAYKPHSLHIDDFDIKVPQKTIVEVKGVETVEELKDLGCVEKAINSIRGTKYDNCEILFLLNYPFEEDTITYLGYLLEKDKELGKCVFSERSKMDFCSEHASWTGRITGEHGGGCGPMSDIYDEIITLWNQACNLTQWKGIQNDS